MLFLALCKCIETSSVPEKKHNCSILKQPTCSTTRFQWKSIKDHFVDQVSISLQQFHESKTTNQLIAINQLILRKFHRGQQMFSFLAYIYIGVTKCVKISLMTKTENTVVKHGLTQT